MDHFSAVVNQGCLTISADGRIDASCSTIFGEKIRAALLDNEHETVCLDLDDLKYISSAGLREILHLRKVEPSLKILNASNEVFEILDTTGFTEIVPVEKARRKVSVDCCTVIGSGANGTVYRLDDETIIKVYNNADALSEIERERKLARTAFVLGIPTAIAYDVVRVGASYGAVFELLNSDSLASLIKKHPEEIDKYAAISVDLLKVIHGTEINNASIPNMKETAVNWGRFLLPYLDEEIGTKLVKMIEDVPDVNHMMHGDYHLKNVMIQGNEALLIDMDTICQGHPIFEFASVYNAYLGFYEYTQPDDSAITFLGIPYGDAKKFFWKTLELYFNDKTERERMDLYYKMRLMGLVRLMRRTIRRAALNTAEGRKEVEFYKNAISESVTKLHSIAF